MKKILLSVIVLFSIITPTFALDNCNIFKTFLSKSDERAVKKVLNSQVKYANKMDYNNFIATFAPKYLNSDGFNLDVYATIVKDIWDAYDIEYDIEIKDVSVDGSKAVVNSIEKSYAEISLNKAYDGELKSEANTIYYLEKNEQGVWKVVSDRVVEETTTILYGDAKKLDIKLQAPKEIKANTDYTATLEFEPPSETIAIASIASDIVQYPQEQTKEVYRSMPEDNILERIFTSNTENKNEYVIASIGLTKTAIKDLNIRLSLTGFGYKIIRVNVISDLKGDENTNDKN